MARRAVNSVLLTCGFESLHPHDGSIVILTTTHGSRLYGLSHADSDFDTYTVTETLRKPEHKIVGDSDDLTIGFKDFMRQVEKGVPQSLEALFSDQAVINPIWAPYLEGYRATSPDVFDTYQRTIKSFRLIGTFKSIRHSLRLEMNLADLRVHGRFNPTLTKEDAEEISFMAKKLLR